MATYRHSYNKTDGLIDLSAKFEGEIARALNTLVVATRINDKTVTLADLSPGTLKQLKEFWPHLGDHFDTLQGLLFRKAFGEWANSLPQ